MNKEVKDTYRGKIEKIRSTLNTLYHSTQYGIEKSERDLIDLIEELIDDYKK